MDTIRLAKFLLGKTLTRVAARGRMRGRIVETEAYVTGDAAAHSFRGLTLRNRSLFLERGHAYVYFTYGNHYMLNVSGAAEGVGEGVLIRAMEPLEGIELMQRNRGIKNVLDLARGPGRLAQALQIDKGLDGIDLCTDARLWLGAPVRTAAPIGESVRIGITKEANRVLRFFERGNPYVSGPRRLNSAILEARATAPARRL